MEMHEYLDLLTGQIRNKKAGASVAKEIKSHMEDQAQVYMEQGMGQEEALAEAVRQMGNPVEVGIDMDRIHRPRNNWKLLGAMAVLSLVGLLVQYLCKMCIRDRDGRAYYGVQQGRCVSEGVSAGDPKDVPALHGPAHRSVPGALFCLSGPGNRC